jgi:hypothetical protein
VQVGGGVGGMKCVRRRESGGLGFRPTSG